MDGDMHHNTTKFGPELLMSDEEFNQPDLLPPLNEWKNPKTLEENADCLAKGNIYKNLNIFNVLLCLMI